MRSMTSLPGRRVLVLVLAGLVVAGSSAAAAAALPAGVTARLRTIEKSLDKIDVYLAEGKLARAESEMGAAAGQAQQIHRQYRGSFDPKDPAFARVFERFQATLRIVTDARAEADRAAEAADSQSSKRKAFDQRWGQRLNEAASGRGEGFPTYHGTYTPAEVREDLAREDLTLTTSVERQRARAQVLRDFEAAEAEMPGEPGPEVVDALRRARQAHDERFARTLREDAESLHGDLTRAVRLLDETVARARAAMKRSERPPVVSAADLERVDLYLTDLARRSAEVAGVSGDLGLDVADLRGRFDAARAANTEALLFAVRHVRPRRHTYEGEDAKAIQEALGREARAEAGRMSVTVERVGPVSIAYATWDVTREWRGGEWHVWRELYGTVVLVPSYPFTFRGVSFDRESGAVLLVHVGYAQDQEGSAWGGTRAYTKIVDAMHESNIGRPE